MFGRLTIGIVALALALSACGPQRPPSPPPPPAKSAFEICMDRLDRDYPAMTTSAKVVRCKGVQ